MRGNLSLDSRSNPPATFGGEDFRGLIDEFRLWRSAPAAGDFAALALRRTP